MAVDERRSSLRCACCFWGLWREVLFLWATKIGNVLGKLKNEHLIANLQLLSPYKFGIQEFEPAAPQLHSQQEVSFDVTCDHAFPVEFEWDNDEDRSIIDVLSDSVIGLQYTACLSLPDEVTRLLYCLSMSVRPLGIEYFHNRVFSDS